MKSTLYLTAKVQPGSKIELQSSNLSEGQIVEVIIIIPETENDNNTKNNELLDARKT